MAVDFIPTQFNAVLVTLKTESIAAVPAESSFASFQLKTLDRMISGIKNHPDSELLIKRINATQFLIVFYPSLEIGVSQAIELLGSNEHVEKAEGIPPSWLIKTHALSID